MRVCVYQRIIRQNCFAAAHFDDLVLAIFFSIHIIKYEFIWIHVYLFITEFTSENNLFYVLKNQTLKR